ncbi:MAG TPA: hypothetical protein VHM19_07590 [Polyangiales bacterium]|nr:hypothetical protein [Polyangiales bacterium]
MSRPGVGGNSAVNNGFAGTGGTFGGAGFGNGEFGGGNGAGGAGGSTATAGRKTSGTSALPCDVNDVLKTSCQSCHAASPLAGVPMALISWEDTQQPSVSNPAMTVHDMMKLRIHSMTAPMPPTGMLPADKLATLDAWLDGGAVVGTDPTCKPITPGDDPGTYYGGTMPPDVENCYEVHAHANSVPGDTAPLMSNGEHYASFYFDAPWPDGAQGVYFETLPGDHPEILHHWLIYSEENGNTADGTVSYPASGSHPSSPTLVAGWAPGASNNDIPSNVGLQLSGPNRKMSMEIHFFGPEGTPIPTTAGVKICTVEKNLRPNTATISWLGTELGINIPPHAQDSTATGTCTPQFNGDIHVLRSWPHMHLTGRKMTATVIRSNGAREDVSPTGGWPFDFNNEVSFKTEYVLHPGDKVETVCHYTNDSDRSIQVGFENRYEMCFNFTIAYPAKALVNKGFAGSTSLTNSATACLY